MLEASIAAVAVAGLGWDAWRRYLDTRKVDEKAELEARIKATNDAIAQLAVKVAQVGNRPRLNRVRGA